MTRITAIDTANDGVAGSSELVRAGVGQTLHAHCAIVVSELEPRAEGRLAPERVDLPDHGVERIPHGLFRVLLIACDARREAIGSLTMRAHEAVSRRGPAVAKRLEEI